MTQAIVCCNSEGLVLATDSVAVEELADGQVERRADRRLFSLGGRAAIVSAGAAAGVDLAGQLSQWLEPRGRMDLDDVLALGRDFLAQGYARYLRTKQVWLEEHPAACRHLYFIIGGYSADPASAPYEAILLQSEAGELPFQETHLGRVFTLPRRVALEGRMTRQIAEGAGLRALAESCRAGLEGVAERNPESVGGPFHMALVTAAGVEFLEEPQGGPGDEEDE